MVLCNYIEHLSYNRSLNEYLSTDVTCFTVNNSEDILKRYLEQYISEIPTLHYMEQIEADNVSILSS